MIPFIVAEIGSNWRKYEDNKKNWHVLERQILLAKEYGASAVKFQLFTAEELFGPEVKSTVFANNLDQFALPKDWLPDIKAACERAEIEFMCSAFSLEGFKYVDLFVKRHKLASPEATHSEIVNWLMNQPKQVLFSNGCSSKLNFGREQDIKLSCVSKYPAQVSDYDLDIDLSEGQNWGISDHTFGNDLAIMAKRKGASYYEKHTDFCYFEGLDSPDKVVSINGKQFGEYVKAIHKCNDENPDNIKNQCGNSYARIKTDLGWFRPIPKTADLTVNNPNIVGGKL